MSRDHSLPPFLSLRTPFSDVLVSLNDLQDRGFAEWVFHPGMLFGSREKWWGNRDQRDKPHEGVDFCHFGDEGGQTYALGQGAKVPVMFEGEIVKIESDFLGVSVYVKHDWADEQGWRLWTAYGHMILSQEATVGSRAREGCVLGTVADAREKGSKLLSHLHVTVAWVPASLASETLSWEVLAGPRVSLVDPLMILGCRYRVVETGV